LQHYHIDADSPLGLLLRLNVGDAGNISEVHAASIFREEVCIFGSFCVYISLFRKGQGKGEIEWGLMLGLWQYGQWIRKVVLMALLRALEYIENPTGN
jgi:hypothetical protein